MVAVAFVALNFGALRGWSNRNNPEIEANRVLVLGGLPMAYVLAVGLLVGRCRLGSRSFLLGFVVFGTTALALFVAAASLFIRELVWPYLNLVLVPLSFDRHGSYWPLYRQQIVGSVMLGLPQLVFALFGGLVFRKFRIGARSGQVSC
jgi:hypothetical protein